MLYKQLVHEYTNWLTLKGYKPRGIEEKERAVKQYFNYTQTQGIDIYRSTPSEAEGYREYLRLMVNKDGKTQYNPKTINGRISYIRLFYHYLLTINKAYRNPFLDIDKMKERESIPKNILTIKQMKKLLEAITVQTSDDFKFKVLIELLYSSGLRISEVENMKQSDVNLDAGYILIRDDKSRQDRHVPLTEYACILFKLYMRHQNPIDDYVFKHGKKRTLNRWINDRLKRLTANLDLPLLTCHGIRHTIATHLLKNGADLREVQEILGHKRIKNTEVYIRIFPEDLKDVIEKTHPRESVRHIHETEKRANPLPV